MSADLLHVNNNQITNNQIVSGVIILIIKKNHTRNMRKIHLIYIVYSEISDLKPTLLYPLNI